MADLQPSFFCSFLLVLITGFASGAIAQPGGAEAMPLLLADNSAGTPAFMLGQAPAEPRWPEGLLQLPASQRYILWVELEQGWLKVLERRDNGGLVMRRQVPVSIGKQGIGKEREGDQKTPLGIYRITSHLSDNSLDDFYVIGAYPLDYPNSLGRLEGRTGHGTGCMDCPKESTADPIWTVMDA